MTTPPIWTAVRRAAELVEFEAALRVEARRLELVPERCEEAAELFARASAARTERLELLDRCGLTR